MVRTVLALMVVAQHLWLRGSHFGIYAVFAFYIISGYLMTLIMHRTYGYTRKGRAAFVVNRFLRIYPQYWLAIGLSLALIAVFGQQTTRDYYYLIYLPDSAFQWFQNLAIVFAKWRPIEAAPILSPATWALTVELFFYLLICCGISKTFARVRVWFLLSIAYVPLTFLLDQPWQDRYFPIAAGSLPFSIGAGIYFLKQSRSWSMTNQQARGLFLLLLLNAAFWSALRIQHVYTLAELGFYINLVICAALVYGLATGARPFSAKHDKAIGDYSYPIYLVHWQVGFLCSWLVFGEPFNELSWRGLANFLISAAAMIPICWLALRGVDRRVQVIRDGIKKTRAR